MTLIKQARAEAAATPLVLRRPPEPIAEVIAMPSAETLALKADIERLETDLAEQRRAAKHAVAAARREGHDDAVADDAARTAAMAEVAGEALKAWRERLAEVEQLALSLARVALAKVFGDEADRSGLVASAIAHRVAQLEPHLIVGVTVSDQDFAGDAFDTLRARIDPAIGLTATAVAAGHCRIDLKLGAIELDPANQWAVLDRALGAMAAA